MATFSYTAISLQGERTAGKEDASTERDLAKLLSDKGYLLTSAKEQGKQKGLGEILGFLNSAFGVPLVEKLMFSRNLQVMTASGIPLPRALEVLARQSQSKIFQKALAAMQERVLKGTPLSEAMELYPNIFSDLFSNMVKVGEESGTLEQVLSYITLQLDREHDMKSKVQGALLYPAIVVSTMVGIGILMLVVVVPELAKTFKDLNVQLPLPTQFVIGLGTFFATKWYLALAGFLAVVIGGTIALRSPAVRLQLDTVVLFLPVFSGMTRKINLASTARTLSSLVAAGVPIVRSLEITAKTLGNSHFRQAMEAASQELKKGGKLSLVLQKYPKLYSPIFIQMVEVGEETGQTGTLLAKLAEFYEEEVDVITRSMASVIEPLLMLVIGVVVGFFAISMLQPMYSLLQSLQQQ